MRKIINSPSKYVQGAGEMANLGQYYKLKEKHQLIYWQINLFMITLKER